MAIARFTYYCGPSINRRVSSINRRVLADVVFPVVLNIDMVAQRPVGAPFPKTARGVLNSRLPPLTGCWLASHAGKVVECSSVWRFTQGTANTFNKLLVVQVTFVALSIVTWVPGIKTARSCQLILKMSSLPSHCSSSPLRPTPVGKTLARSHSSLQQSLFAAFPPSAK